MIEFCSRTIASLSPVSKPEAERSAATNRSVRSGLGASPLDREGRARFLGEEISHRADEHSRVVRLDRRACFGIDMNPDLPFQLRYAANRRTQVRRAEQIVDDAVPRRVPPRSDDMFVRIDRLDIVADGGIRYVEPLARQISQKNQARRA